MIPSLLFLLLRRYRRRYPEKAARLFHKLRFAARTAVLIVLAVCVAVYVCAQERMLHYTVMRSGSAIGSLTVKESKSGNRITYKLQSALKTSFLFTITGKAVEEAVYENGILIRSRFYQKVNNNERADIEIQTTGAGYIITNKKNAKPLDSYPITYNMVCLYTIEPLHRTHVFSDKFQKQLPIETLGRHRYRIRFPDGGYNDYDYQAGLCTRIKIAATWFSAEMILKT